MENIAGIIAPIATTIAAIMTAANLGARVTGWGFIVFTIGSLAWCAIAFASGQQNLLFTNAFLTVVNGVGIWRWLCRVARHEDGAHAAEVKSQYAAAPTLVAISNLVGCKIADRDGDVFGKLIGLMAERERGAIAFGVVGVGGVGGVGERLVAIDWGALTISGTEMKTSLSTTDIAARPTVDPEDWPVMAA